MKKTFVKIASNLFPNYFTRMAYHKLTHPQIRKLRDNELKVLDKSKTEDIDFEGFKIRTYAWGTDGEEVLLIHGWEGQAGNFSDLIEGLLEEGFVVRAFDGPCHGFSSQGQTSMFEFCELVGELIKRYQVKKSIKIEPQTSSKD